MENALKLLYITTKNPNAQGDLLEVSIFHGLRTLLGSSCVDYPEKKVMYHDWTETKKEELHGNGFTLYTEPLNNIPSELRNDLKNFDVVLFGTLGNYDGYPDYSYITDHYDDDKIWYLDGHDLHGKAPIMINGIIGNQKSKNCFKRELVNEQEGVYPTGFGIPEYQIREIDLHNKTQKYQITAPSMAFFGGAHEMGGSRHHHKFTDEKAYYDDMQKSWFGLTCKKGGWDCLRHYEIMASSALLLFKDYDKKPPLCSPKDLPCFSYSTKDELNDLMNRLVVNNKHTKEYTDMLRKQRYWLLSIATTVKRAKYVINKINDEAKWKK